MIKRTLYFGNPAYLSCRNEQLVIRLPEVETNDTISDTFKKDAVSTIPIEDIGVLVIDDKRITVTHHLLDRLLENNVAFITCNEQHLPVGLMLPLAGNSTQTERFACQIEASLPLKKQLWQQTIQQKILNQAAVLKKGGAKIDNMIYWASSVKSGDAENHEARAAAYYWKNIFNDKPHFLRDPNIEDENMWLNYGYAILRAIVARALVSSGMLPSFGIHHRNKYNAYCLADDIMEPYRSYVDEVVLLCRVKYKEYELSKAIKAELLSIPTLDVIINGDRAPLMVAMHRTSASLYKCFDGEIRKIAYPQL